MFSWAFLISVISSKKISCCHFYLSSFLKNILKLQNKWTIKREQFFKNVAFFFKWWKGDNFYTCRWCSRHCAVPISLSVSLNSPKMCLPLKQLGRRWAELVLMSHWRPEMSYDWRIRSLSSGVHSSNFHQVSWGCAEFRWRKRRNIIPPAECYHPQIRVE